MRPSVGVCSNVDLRSMEIHGHGTSMAFLESAAVRASLASGDRFWDGPAGFLVFFDPARILPGGRVLSAEDALIEDWFRARLEEFRELARSRSDKLFVVANTALANDTLDADLVLSAVDSGSISARLDGLISQAARGLANVAILDWRRVVLTHGTSKIYDPKYWYLGRMPLSSTGSLLLWQEFESSLALLRGAPRKVLCMDLDNTLWRGICGEEGTFGVGLSEEGMDKAYRDLQRQIRALKQMGALLAINSKNNERDALAVIRDNPMMILKEQDFAAMRINWLDKAENLRSMAAELSLDLDAFVFIDDSHVERELVRTGLPGVAVPEFPSAAFELPAWFQTQVAHRYFRRRKLTDEDLVKTEQYHRRRERQSATGTLSREAAIAQMQIEVTVARDSAEHLTRLHQMTQKTNQFNLTTIRYTESELAKRVQSENYSVWYARYRDRFGDEGIVAMAVVSQEEPRLESFLMSCRVIGRSVEYVLLKSICESLRSFGARTLVAEYRPTDRNLPCRDFLSTAGFDQTGERYSADLSVLIGRLSQLANGIKVYG